MASSNLIIFFSYIDRRNKFSCDHACYILIFFFSCQEIQRKYVRYTTSSCRERNTYQQTQVPGQNSCCVRALCGSNSSSRTSEGLRLCTSVVTATGGMPQVLPRTDPALAPLCRVWERVALLRSGEGLPWGTAHLPFLVLRIPRGYFWVGVLLPTGVCKCEPHPLACAQAGGFSVQIFTKTKGCTWEENEL